MWRKTWIFLATLLISLAPLAAQDGVAAVSVVSAGPCTETNNAGGGGPGAPFGYLEGPVSGGNVVGGLVGLTGWALDDDGVFAVDLTVDGQVVTRSAYGAVRPGVAALYPSYPDSDAAGFSYKLDTTWFTNGIHTVSAVVTSLSGETSNLNNVVLQFNNTVQSLRPFGTIDFPNDNAEWFGVCDPNDSERRYEVISGWALDAGIEDNDHGLGYVELLIDGVVYANSRRDCSHSSVTGAFTNCYGIRTQAIEAIFESLKDAPHAGWRFVVDPGALMNLGWRPGQHVLTIRAGDQDSQVANIDSIVVTFGCDDFFGNQGSFGSIEPVAPGFATAVTQVTGWALDWEGVDRVDVYVNGFLVGEATYGFANPEVTGRYPGYPDSALPGWAFNLETRLLNEGRNVINVEVVDLENNRVGIGEREIVVSNP